ncbi:hypothetical protein SKAU_G00288320 [Synaphobranchus kaupii]|uniref:BAI1-associated protein 3 n=1 Tax=Synaphobranchus kaupii TaxID=118154 RepID=A0A9Q1ILU2_SYNKA|nr:hypothetical protein SKAU_G00288320 [Synaphobranchus kaupii]
MAVHEKILSQILEYEHTCVQTEPYSWDGRVCQEAWTVLSHHAEQTDLSPLQQAIIRWCCYSSHHRSQRMCYSFQLELLGAIKEEWDPQAMKGELEERLVDSFRLHTEYCLSLLRNLQKVFPSSVPTAIIRCELMLRGLGLIHTVQVFRSVCPLRSQLHLEISSVIKKGAVEWYGAKVSHFKPDEGVRCSRSRWMKQLKRLVLVVDAVCVDVYRAQTVYNKLFGSSVKVDFFSISYRQLEKLVADHVSVTMESAVEEDQLAPIHSLAKHSSSAVDITSCFTQVRDFWVQLDWPDSAGAFIFVTRLTDDFCSAAVCYCELIKRKIERGQLGHDHKTLTVQLCIALNNIEHVRLFLGNLPKDLDWRGLEHAMEESCGAEGKEQVNKALNAQLYNMDVDLQREAKRMITHLTDKVLVDLRKYIQHISLSPDSIQNDDAVSPLMKYLDDTLVILSESLVKENLARVLHSLWELVLRMIFDTVMENRGVQMEFYGRFHYTMETLVVFFHAEGEGLALEDLRNGDYKALEEELRLNKCSSNELIEQYFLEKIAQQRILKHSRFGRISVKCYYEAPEQRLTVEILHAADIIALDANGLSDPFVIVELCPHHLFPMTKSQRTQVKTKTLHPVFDELFYFHVSPEQYRNRYACVTFTVMDYDWLSTNDFAGDAVAPLSDFCWPGRPSASAGGKNLPPVILHLTRSKPSEKSIVKMLEARTADREAQEFSKMLKEIEKAMEEE